MRLAENEMQSLIERAGLRNRLREDGNLELYESEAELAASQPGWDVREKAGIAYEHVRGRRLAELQPGLNPRFVAGTFVPGWKNVSDPKLFGKAIWSYAESLGARFLSGKVASAKRQNGGVRLRLENGVEINATHLVLMAGAWSRDLAKGFGDIVPLDTERGYNTTLLVGSFDVKRQLTFPGHGFVITPMETGLRVGGAVEFGRLDLPPNFARSEAMLKKASKFCRALRLKAAGNGWGIGPPCRIPFRLSAALRRVAMFITVSAMGIWALRNRRRRRGLSATSSRVANLQSISNLSSLNVFGTDHNGKTFLLLRRWAYMRQPCAAGGWRRAEPQWIDHDGKARAFPGGI